MHFPPDGDGTPTFIYLNGGCYGKACFSGWTVKGTIGCSLAHLSVLNDAYNEGFNTIWVMEDDISLEQNPHELSDLIEELDALVGPDGWDVLYTDAMHLVINPDTPIETQIPYLWRPDMVNLDLNYFAKHQDVGTKFMKIGSRDRAHSIIYRRSGIKKILDFYRAHNNFLPYDVEMSLIPGVNKYVIKRSVVTAFETTTDTRHRHFNN